jgi:shikimate 5-dehydrogenase
MLINKDTALYGSFSLTPGNNGCKFFNTEFERLGMNAIYKSFYSDDIVKSFQAAKILRFKGFAVAIPYKVSIMSLLSKIDLTAQIIGAVNTVVLEDGIYVGYNTDWEGAQKFLLEKKVKEVSIAGTGGFSKAIQYACQVNSINYEVLTRKDIILNINPRFDIFNATPIYIACKYDGRPNTDDGKLIAKYQAQKQLKLYVQKT